MKGEPCLRLALLLVSLPVVTKAQGEPWYQTDFPPEEFQARRAKLLEAIGERAVAALARRLASRP